MVASRPWQLPPSTAPKKVNIRNVVFFKDVGRCKRRTLFHLFQKPTKTFTFLCLLDHRKHIISDAYAHIITISTCPAVLHPCLSLLSNEFDTTNSTLMLFKRKRPAHWPHSNVLNRRKKRFLISHKGCQIFDRLITASQHSLLVCN